MERNESISGNKYCIRVKGTVLGSVVASLGGITIISKDDNETELIGQFVDQPALRGFMEHLWNLNFTILSFEKVES